MRAFYKTIQYEFYPTLILYMLSMFVMTFRLQHIILFSVGVGGQLITAVGEGMCSTSGKFLKLFGRIVAHGPTLVMLVYLITDLFYARVPPR